MTLFLLYINHNMSMCYFRVFTSTLQSEHHIRDTWCSISLSFVDAINVNPNNGNKASHKSKTGFRIHSSLNLILSGIGKQNPLDWQPPTPFGLVGGFN